MKTLRALSVTVVLAFLVSFVPQENTYGQAVVVPNKSVEQSDFPFQFFLGCFEVGYHLQIIYPADQLIQGYITNLKIRLYPGSEGFEFTLPNVTIKLSTTDADPNNPSPIFADNVGPDETVVFQGDINPLAAPCNTDPCPFFGLIGDSKGFTTAFPYDPSQGNLLFDYTVAPCLTPSPPDVFFDATNEFIAVEGYETDIEGFNVDNITFIAQLTFLRSVTITKVTDPSGGDDFGFESDGFDSQQGCPLDGGGDGMFVLNDGDSLSCIVPEGNYSIKENIPQGYRLSILCFEAPDNIAINNQTGEIEFTIDDSGSDVDCLYTNVRKGGGGGGCALAPVGASTPIPLYLLIPVLIFIRRIIKRNRG